MRSVLTQLVGFVAVFVLAGCNQNNSKSLGLDDSASLLSPPKAGTTPLRADLTRFRGQTSFLTTQASYGYRGGPMPMMAAASPAGGGAPRAEQEADVFKVGKPGSKLLYLLNNYRGLQVVSFAKGEESPELLGRAEPTGNYPSDMYLDPNKDRLFVLERVWFSSQGSIYNENQSRILVYDVSSADAPKIVDQLDVKGEIADSRVVGQVLYVVSTLRPNSNSYSYGPQKDQTGIVTSYDLSGSKVNQIEQVTLSLPAVYGNNLRVVTVPENNSYKYYLVAHLSQNGWGWWDNQSMVQVVDISDDHGKITNVMSVSVKGSIQRPQQMQIKNNTLIAVSNYRISAPVANNANNQISRIAVETFKFPVADSELVSEDEAQLRRLYIEKQVKLAIDQGADKDEARKKWMNDSTWGMQGRFIKTDTELKKLAPDSVVTTGDTTGLSANLQDVRVQNGLLYAFWVPANQVDPLDVFDISSPETGVKFLKRLSFDGWISRAEPISYKGHNYIIGLGWIVPAENNENNKRFAQVKLFEVTSNSKVTQAAEVESLVLNKSQFWANFTGQDKFIEFKMTGDGQGEILFEGSRYQQSSAGISSYQEGGQLISFDLAQAAGSGHALKEGSFLAGESTWLKRIFTNSEIDRVNSFSDASLVTFSKMNKASVNGTVSAAHILELARNIRGYAVIAGQGVQIVSESNYWGGTAKPVTSIRMVSKTNVDVEKNKVADEITLPGTYVQHVVDLSSQSLVVLTSQALTTNKSYSTSYQIHRVHIGSGLKSVAVSTQSWTPSETSGSSNVPMVGISSLVPRYYGYSQANMVKLPSGDILISSGKEMKLLSALNMANKSVVLQGFTFDKCQMDADMQVEIKILDGKTFLFTKKAVDLKSEFKTYFQSYRNQLISLTIDKTVATCGKAINIPGAVLSFDGQRMVVSDSWVNDIYQNKEAKQDVLNTTNSLTSLKLSQDGTKLELVDMIDSSKGTNDFMVLGSGQNQSLVRYVSQATERYSTTVATMEFVKTDANAFLVQETYHLPESALNYASLSKVLVEDPKMGTYLGVIKSWRQMQVVRWSAKDNRPEVVRLAAVDKDNNRMPLANLVSVLEGYSSADTLNYTPELKSLEVSSGQYGLMQFFLE